jgi:hypothetical protein
MRGRRQATRDVARRQHTVIAFTRFRVSIQKILRCSVVACSVASLSAAPRQAIGQSGPPPTQAAPPNPFAPAPSTKRVPISKAVFGDAGVIVNARDDGFIEVAAAGPQKTIYLKLRTAAARAWIDSTQRMLKARARKADPPRTYRSDVTEYGSTTTMALTRSVDAGQSQYSLGFSENPQSAFTIPIEEEEADVFVAIIRKAETQTAKMLEKTDTTAALAADSARADSVAKAKKKKKPAAKRTAPPPADSATKPKSDSAAKPKPD